MHKITTVEELSNVPDDAIRKIDPLLTAYKYKAIEFIKNRESKFISMDKKIKERDDKIDDLQKQLQDAIKRLNTLSNERPHTTAGKRGRPKRTLNDTSNIP